MKLNAEIEMKALHGGHWGPGNFRYVLPLVVPAPHAGRSWGCPIAPKRTSAGCPGAGPEAVNKHRFVLGRGGCAVVRPSWRRIRFLPPAPWGLVGALAPRSVWTPNRCLNSLALSIFTRALTPAAEFASVTFINMHSTEISTYPTSLSC